MSRVIGKPQGVKTPRETKESNREVILGGDRKRSTGNEGFGSDRRRVVRVSLPRD